MGCVVLKLLRIWYRTATPSSSNIKEFTKFALIYIE